MGRKIIVFFIVLSALLSTPRVFAQTTEPIDSSETAEISPTKTQENADRSTTEERNKNLDDRMELKKEEIKESFQQRLEIKKKEAQSHIQLKREEFKNQLTKIKEERKKQLLQRIQDKTAQVNSRRTDFMSAVLEKLSSILARLEERVDNAKAEGKNTTLAENAIAAAKQKIEVAKSALELQAGKAYSLDILTEGALKATVGQTVSLLESDLKSVHAAVVTAKQAVADTVREVAKLHDRPNVNPTKEISPTETLLISPGPSI